MIGQPQVVANVDDVAGAGYGIARTDHYNGFIHTDAVYVALMSAVTVMENRLKHSLEEYQAHPDVQANLQQLQYDLQQWNLALTTMTNINKNLGDALNSIASNFR